MAKASKVVTQPFPVLDWAALEKGQTLDAVTCAQAMGVSVAVWRADRFLALKLKADIREHRDDLSAHVRCDGDTIQILDDTGAEEYTWSEAKRAARHIKTQQRRRGAIDHAKISSEQRRLAESRDAALSRLRVSVAREIRSATPPKELPPKPPQGGEEE